MIDKIKNSLFHFLQDKKFVFRFQYYSVTTTINDTDVVQYEFINQGNTICEINGLQLFPLVVGGVLPITSRFLLNIGIHEKDVTIYRVKFIPLANPDLINNKLLVIMKIKAGLLNNP